ncbi:MAG: carbohydrate ABC transporter permease [Actinobacteria bacterium]|nr:carbohydrate ABC transporter permease [Actinomycetota bacterium]
MFKNKLKVNRGPIALNVFEYIMMYGWLLIVVFPFAWILSLSLRKTQGVFKNLFFQSFHEITFENYFYLFKGEFPYRKIQIFFINAFKNSFIVTTVSVIIIIVIALLAGYAFAKLKFFGRSASFYFILAGMMIPVQVIMLPLFRIVKIIGIQNSLLSIILPYIAIGLPLSIFLFTGFFKNIPDALIEAAKIEGANNFQILTKIILPLSKPVIGANIIFQFMFNWNEFSLALVLLQKANLYTLPIEITKVQGQYMTPWNIFATAAMAAIIPVIVIYLIFQKQFVSGLTAGAIKE